MHAYTLSEIVRKNRKIGHHFFAAETLDYWKSKIFPRVYNGPGGVYFVTSETDALDEAVRSFKVRRFNPDTGDVRTADMPYKPETEGEADKLAYSLAAGPAAGVVVVTN